MAKDLKTDFWNRIDDVQAGMLTTGDGRAVPMSPMADKDANALWFITAKGTDVAQAAEVGTTASLQVADPKANLYANVQGHIAAEDDPEKLDELWSVVASAWFQGGRHDGKVRLVRMTPATAEVWATDSAAGFLYEIAKARVSNDQPDVGEHGTLTF